MATYKRRLGCFFGLMDEPITNFLKCAIKRDARFLVVPLSNQSIRIEVRQNVVSVRRVVPFDKSASVPKPDRREKIGILERFEHASLFNQTAYIHD